MHDLLLIGHIIAGSVGLVLAGPILLVPKRPGWHTYLGRTYAIATIVLFISAVGLWWSRPGELIGLLILGILTMGWVTAGFVFVHYKPIRNWKIWHLNMMGSSVIAFVTAFVVQIADGHWLAWILPTIVGSPLIARRAAREVRAGLARTVVVSTP